MTNETQPTWTMTDTEAEEEAFRLFFRKASRLMPAELFNEIWAKLPDGAGDALHRVDLRADNRRFIEHKGEALAWPVRDLDD